MSESDTMFNERDRRCAAVQLTLSTDPSYAKWTIASTLKIQIRTVQRAQGDENKVFGYGYGLWCGFKWGPDHATSHLRSRLESQHQSVPVCAEECGDPLVQSGSRWQTLGIAAGLSASPQVQRDLGLASEGVLRLSLTGPLLTRPESAGLRRLVIRREHHQYDLTQHQSQPDYRYPPSISRAPAGACGKIMLLLLDPYRGVDWGWRLLHWIDVNSTTKSSYLNLFFNKNFRIKL